MTDQPSAGHSAGLALARILRPWGRRGEVAAEILTSFPQRLTSLHDVLLCDGRNPPRPATLRSCRIHLGQAVFHFQGIDSISDAERLRGLEVQVPLAERVVLAPGRHFISDLVGCEVWEHAATGGMTRLGTVGDVQGSGAGEQSSLPMASYLVVQTSEGEVLIPLAAEICTQIDITARRIEVRLPDGLRELNRETAGSDTPPRRPS